MHAVEIFFFELLGGASCLSVAALNASLGILVLFFLVRSIRSRFVPRSSDWILLLFFFWNVFISIFSPDRAQAFHGVQDFWPWLAYFAGVALSERAREKEPQFAALAALSALAALVPSAAAFFWNTDFRIQRLYGHLPMGVTPGKGFFTHHLTYAGVCAVLGLYLAGRALYSEDRRKIWLWIGAAACGSGVLLSQARSYWLALGVGLLVLVWPKGWRWRGGLAAALVAGALILVFLAPSNLRNRALSLFDSSNPSNVERVCLWQSGAEMLAERPVTGWGPSTYELFSPPFRAPYAGGIHYPDHDGFRTVSHCHNLYLQIALDSGIVGLLLFLGFAGMAAWSLLKGKNSPDAGRGFLAAWATFLIAGLFEFNGGDAEVATVIFFLLGLGCSGQRPADG